jgi:thymidylate kinase
MNNAGQRIIEFCGLPGAGKSSLCEALLLEIRASGRDGLSRSDLIQQGLSKRNFGILANTVARLVPGWREALFALPHAMEDWIAFTTRYPAYTAKLHFWLADASLTTLDRETMMRAVAASAFERALAEETGGILLLDEGFGQRYFTLRGYHGLEVEGDALDYVQRMPKPSLLIFVDTEPSVCAERVQRRVSIPLMWKQLPDADMHEVFVRGGKALRHFVNCVEEETAFPVLRLEGMEDLSATAARIRNMLLESSGCLS